MGDWSDDENPKSTAVPFGTKLNNNVEDDDWGNKDTQNGFSRGRGRGGYNQGNRDYNNDGEGSENRGFSGRGPGGRGGYNRENRDYNNDEEGSENRGFSGRGRGGRGGYNRENRDYNNDEEGSENRGFSGRGRGGRGGFNRENRDYNNDEEGSENRGFSGRGRGGRGGFNRGNRDFEGNDHNDEFNDRPQQKNRDENQSGENSEEKKREIYIPVEPTEDDDMFGNCISAGINFDKFDNIEVSVTGKGAEDFPQLNTFEDAEFREFILNNITKSGYKKPTPIQKRAMNIIMGRRDLMGCAQTGSGKTAAFVLPILNTIMTMKWDMNPGKPQCLILAPTRELAIQIRDEAMKFAMGSYIKVCLIYGGAATRYQNENVVKGCHILVATPGRLMDFLNKGVLTFDDLKFLVLDEADRMLDMGFRETIDQVCNHSTIDKDELTTLMFSATFPDEIQRLASKYLRNYLFLTVGIVGGASADVEQEFIEVTRRTKRKKLTEILQEYCDNKDEDRILVFVETKKTADFIACIICETTTISATSIHGDRLQREREEALRDFRSGKRKVLVATAVAARGLDIKGVTHVINYDLPKEVDEYIHRIGRTGRVGNRGKATSFYDPDTDSEKVNDIVRILTQAKQPIPEFFSASGNGNYTDFDNGGRSDIRQPLAPGVGQQDEEDW